MHDWFERFSSQFGEVDRCVLVLVHLANHSAGSSRTEQSREKRKQRASQRCMETRGHYWRAGRGKEEKKEEMRSSRREASAAVECAYRACSIEGRRLTASMSLLCENTFVTLWRCTSDADARRASVGYLDATASDGEGRKERERAKDGRAGSLQRCCGVCAFTHTLSPLTMYSPRMTCSTGASFE